MLIYSLNIQKKRKILYLFLFLLTVNTNCENRRKTQTFNLKPILEVNRNSSLLIILHSLKIMNNTYVLSSKNEKNSLFKICQLVQESFNLPKYFKSGFWELFRCEGAGELLTICNLAKDTDINYMHIFLIN